MLQAIKTFEAVSKSSTFEIFFGQVVLNTTFAQLILSLIDRSAAVERILVVKLFESIKWQTCQAPEDLPLSIEPGDLQNVLTALPQHDGPRQSGLLRTRQPRIDERPEQVIRSGLMPQAKYLSWSESPFLQNLGQLEGTTMKDATKRASDLIFFGWVWTEAFFAEEFVD